jgi:hypothetical protein
VLLATFFFSVFWKNTSRLRFTVRIESPVKTSNAFLVDEFERNYLQKNLQVGMDSVFGLVGDG